MTGGTSNRGVSPITCQSLPSTPETVALYIADRASSLAAGTITRRHTSITKAHRAAGYKDSPATTNSSARPSIEVGDITFHQDGVVIDLRRSNMDQEGAGRQVGPPFGAGEETCPVRALQRRLMESGITAGLAFRYVSGYGRVAKRGLNRDSIGRLLKQAAARAGMKVAHLGGHSLHAGHFTQAARNWVTERVIMQQTGHKTVATLRRYPEGRDVSGKCGGWAGHLRWRQGPGKFRSRTLAPARQAFSCPPSFVRSFGRLIGTILGNRLFNQSSANVLSLRRSTFLNSTETYSCTTTATKRAAVLSSSRFPELTCSA